MRQKKEQQAVNAILKEFARDAQDELITLEKLNELQINLMSIRVGLTNEDYLVIKHFYFILLLKKVDSIFSLKEGKRLVQTNLGEIEFVQPTQEGREQVTTLGKKGTAVYLLLRNSIHAWVADVQGEQPIDTAGMILDILEKRIIDQKINYTNITEQVKNYILQRGISEWLTAHILSESDNPLISPDVSKQLQAFIDVEHQIEEGSTLPNIDSLLIRKLVQKLLSIPVPTEKIELLMDAERYGAPLRETASFFEDQVVQMSFQFIEQRVEQLLAKQPELSLEKMLRTIIAESQFSDSK